jgi:3-deoxy-D-manno-octulosonic-acid transferase
MIFNFIFLFIYRFIVTPIALFLLFLVYWPLDKKTKDLMRLRLQKKLPATTSEQPFWIHSSSGEFEYAKPVIAALKAKHPNTPIVVTYSSPSYAKPIEKFPGVDFSLPLPLDTPGAVSSFLRKLRPKALLVARTDLWPELLLQVKKNNIQALLFSCTFRPMTGPRVILKLYYRFLFNQFSEVYSVSQADSDNILSTGTTTHIVTTGDTRFDQVISRLQNPKPLKDNIFDTASTPILVCGSTWREDENIIFSAAAELVKDKKLRLIIAPHEPNDNHIRHIIAQAGWKQLSHETYTHLVTENKIWSTDILLVDKIGILAEIYTKGHIAFVGGSFKAKVHSVMEPLATGLITLVGPHHTNNREAIQFSQLPINDKLHAVEQVRDIDELKSRLQTLINSIESLKSVQLVIKNEVLKRTGATTRVLQWVEKLR